MFKEEKQHVHLDDWEHCEDLYNDPIGSKILWGSPKSKNIDYKVEHPVFSTDEKGKTSIFLILISSLNLKIWNKVIFYKNFRCFRGSKKRYY